MDVRRYLLVLDMNLLAADERCELGPISYLVARQEHERCEVVVLPLRTCCPAVPPTLYQAPPSRHHEKYRREPLAYVRAPADWLLSSVPRTTWRPCSTSGRRRTPDRHRGPEGLAEARCRTRSTGLPPMAGAGCAA